jgi:ribosome-associated protein
LTNSNTEIELQPSEQVNFIAKTLSDKKAEKIRILDLRGVTTMADYFIICTSASDVHSKTLADEVSEKVADEYYEKPWRREGLEVRRWIILDYVHVVVHIFNAETRDYYGLERMWNDAKVTSYTD